MATSTTASSQPSAGVDWDEGQCIAALAELERFAEQIQDLRLVIPRVLAPLHNPPTPSAFLAARESAIESQRSLANFKAQWQSRDVQAIMEHAKDSLEKNKDMSTCRQEPQFGWIEAEKKYRRKKEKQEQSGKKAGEVETVIPQEEVDQIVLEWRKKHGLLGFEAKEGNRDFVIKFNAMSRSLEFQISVPADGAPSTRLAVECKGTSAFSQCITRSITSDANSNDLKYVLDMVAAYKTVSVKECAKCRKMLDSSIALSTARRKKQTRGEAEEDVWEALHESCLE